MEIPQTGRQPMKLNEEQVQMMLRKRRRQDKYDPFATDPNREISTLGKLALRRDDVNDLFALGDICARGSLTEDNRLLIFYVGKALIAYRRAMQTADNIVDRKLARRAINEYIKWVLHTAHRHPTRRNLAVALWAAADDDEHNTGPDSADAGEANPRKLQALADQYMEQVPDLNGAADALSGSATEADTDYTRADTSRPPLPVSDASMTVADLGPDEEAFSRAEAFYEASEETRIEDHRSVSATAFDSDTSGSGNDDTSKSNNVDNIRTNKRTSEFVPGDRIENRYEVADVLWGGMGVVYLCYDHEQREAVAIKSFQERFLENERAVARFTHEAVTWIRVEKHRHIVQARLVQQVSGRPHIILEHISGPEGLGSDLRSWIDHNRIDIPKAIEFGLHIGLGMQHATQRVPGLVHRDLKPANILVTHESIAKVTDFGLVRSVDLDDLPLEDHSLLEDDSDDSASNRLTKVGAIVGTAPYMSPEQCQSLDVDMRADIYAFGCLLYEMLTGSRVFKARRFQEWMKAHINQQPTFDAENRQKIPEPLQKLVLSCLEKNPNNRPANWSDIVDKLAALYTEVTGEDPVLEITGPALEARELMDKGYSLTALGRFDEALEAYDRAIELQPDYAWAWARKGRTMRLLERYDDALNCYNQALEIQPRYAWAWNGKGIILERLGRLDEARACFTVATEINPNDVWSWYNLADVLQTMGHYREAIPLLERGLHLDPVHPNSWAKLGQIHRLRNNHEEAVYAYEQAIRLEPTYAWAHNGCGLALKALGRTKDALMAFKRATRYQPNQVWHWYNLTEMLVDLGQYEDAVQPAQEATKTDPTHAFSWAKLGQVLRYVRRHEQAVDAYDQAISLEPNSAWAINGKGIVLEQIERYEEALACYQRAAELKPGDVWHWYNQGNVLVLLGEYEQALETLTKATQINPRHARSWARMSNALRHLERYDESLHACQQATRSAPNYAWAWHEQGITLEKMHRLEDALKAYRRASEIAPHEQFYIYKQTDVLNSLKRYDEARAAGRCIGKQLPRSANLGAARAGTAPVGLPGRSAGQLYARRRAG